MRTEDRKERHDGVVLVWAAARAGAAYTRMVAATRHLSVRRLVTTTTPSLDRSGSSSRFPTNHHQPTPYRESDWQLPRKSSSAVGQVSLPMQWNCFLWSILHVNGVTAKNANKNACQTSEYSVRTTRTFWHLIQQFQVLLLFVLSNLSLKVDMSLVLLVCPMNDVAKQAKI